MTTFNNGPARGTVLRLHRAPFFLRVCVGPVLDDTDHRTKIDALDQVNDAPRPHEQLFAYRLTAKPGMCHIRASQGQGGFFTLADYTLVDPQPAGGLMRNRKAWVAWCEENAAMMNLINDPPK